MSTLKEAHEQIEKFRSKVISCLSEISELDITCMTVLEKHLKDPKLINSVSTVKIQAIIDYIYEQVNIGNWKEVRLYLRKTITIASYLRLFAHIKSVENFSDEAIKVALKIVDFGILFGCPLHGEPELLQECATNLHSALTIHCEASTVSTENVCCNKNNILNISDNLSILNVVSCPSMENFYTDHILAAKPVVLDNCINHWPALTKWQDQSYFIKLAGLRTVTIELGRDYTDSKWTQKMMTIEDFIKNHIYGANSTTGYLAQYQLFDQIPELKDDIKEPEYCCFSEKDDSVDIMAWYGPKGTVSPLHHDPKKNLLAQVIGEKEIFLFSPQNTEYLYPHKHEMLNNTAQVDPRKPDYVKHPKYQEARGYYCVLKPGQMLYIPPKWWHFVESLSVSFSVSFWWE